MKKWKSKIFSRSSTSRRRHPPEPSRTKTLWEFQKSKTKLMTSSRISRFKWWSTLTSRARSAAVASKVVQTLRMSLKLWRGSMLNWRRLKTHPSRTLQKMWKVSVRSIHQHRVYPLRLTIQERWSTNCTPSRATPMRMSLRDSIMSSRSKSTQLSSSCRVLEKLFFQKDKSLNLKDKCKWWINMSFLLERNKNNKSSSSNLFMSSRWRHQVKNLPRWSWKRLMKATPLSIRKISSKIGYKGSKIS
jgi:hypothetical protein